MSYKLRYFNVMGMGESIRFIFALAEQEYVDERIEYEGPENYRNGKEWVALKPNTLWGTLPELEYDGIRLCQASTIVRFLGSKFGLAGKSDIDRANVDMLMSCIGDILVSTGQIYNCPSPAEKEEKTKEMAPKFQDYVRRFNDFLVANNDGNGWLVGDSVTIADVFACSYLPYVKWFYPNIYDDYPKLQSLMKRFGEIPQIAAWVAKRPKTDR